MHLDLAGFFFYSIKIYRVGVFAITAEFDTVLGYLSLQFIYEFSIKFWILQYHISTLICKRFWHRLIFLWKIQSSQQSTFDAYFVNIVVYDKGWILEDMSKVTFIKVNWWRICFFLIRLLIQNYRNKILHHRAMQSIFLVFLNALSFY